MANRVELPPNPKLAGKIIEAEAFQATRKQEMGWVGRCFGGSTEKPGNIAGFAIVFSILMMAALAFETPTDPRVPIEQLYTLFGGIITLALGYLFGRSGGPPS